LAKTLAQRLQSVQDAIERSELALENSVAGEHNVKRESLETLYRQERRLEKLIEEKGADYIAGQTITNVRRGYVRFS